VISKNASLVRRFSAYEFEEGLEPSQPTPHPTMDRLYHMVLEAARGEVSLAAGGSQWE
jgi:hypothetical protein